jgi:hypothetical protein
MAYSTGNYWGFGLCPSSGILKNTREHKVSETGSVSVLRRGEATTYVSIISNNTVHVPVISH